MREIICWFKGHIWANWIWSEELEFACRKCNKCNKLEWGCIENFASGNPKFVKENKCKLINN